MSGNGSSIEPSYVYEINRVYDSHVNDLRTELKKTSENIDGWARSLRSQIDKHAQEQKDLLQLYFTERQHVLHDKRKETIDEMRKFSAQYAYDQINDLLNQCKRLKFELLVRLISKDQTIQLIQCVTKDHLEQSKKNESTVAKTGNYASIAQLEMKDSYANLSPDTTSKNESQNTQSSSTTKTANNDHHSMNNSSGNQNSQATANNLSEDKCPICFMIFPSRMELDDRQRHVEEHY